MENSSGTSHLLVTGRFRGLSVYKKNRAGMSLPEVQTSRPTEGKASHPELAVHVESAVFNNL